MTDTTQLPLRSTARDPDSAWLDVYIDGDDEACEALVQTNDNLDQGQPNMYADWILIYKRCHTMTAVDRALANHGTSHVAETGTIVTVKVNGTTV